MEGNWTPSGANGEGNKYQYNGKELNEDFGLNWNDYGARFYDAAIGRWLSIDQKSEKYFRWSQYNYTLCNPIKYVDPDGNEVKPTNEFIASKYNAIYKNLIANSSLYNEMLKPYAGKGIDLVLDYKNYLDPGERTVGSQLAKTRNLPGIQYNVRTGLPNGGGQSTFFIPQNESIMVGEVTKNMNDLGRALILIHESIHNHIYAVEVYSLGVTVDQDQDYAADIQANVVEGLKEFNKANKLGLKDEDLELLAWFGTGGSQDFNKNFGFDSNASAEEKQKKFDELKEKFNSLIYNTQEEDKNGRNNVKPSKKD
jgi:RHS repeat-associated protein